LYLRLSETKIAELINIKFVLSFRDILSAIVVVTIKLIPEFISL
jgi:hypothetical protein